MENMKKVIDLYENKNKDNKMENMKKVIDLYEKYGNKGYIGEEVSQLEHAVQVALLSEEYYQYLDEKIKIELVLGAFLHDVGHLMFFENIQLETMGCVGVKNHEEIGALFLEELNFPDLTCQLVRNHIVTKRYLITMRKDYYQNMSDASKETFKYQGGKLNEEEIKNFEKDKYFDYHLRLREFDDKAKSTDTKLLQKIKEMEPILYYKNMIEIYYNMK